jgi:hypothetical protein
VAASSGLSQDEQAELERLRAEMTELRERQARQVAHHRISDETWLSTVRTEINSDLGIRQMLTQGASEVFVL